MKDGKRCSGSIPYGYNRLATDKQTLVVDPVASEVVKRIFLLANEGKSPRAIAELLTEEKVLIPAAHAKEYHPEQYNGIKFTDPYLWGMSTIRAILSRQEILVIPFCVSRSAPISNCTKGRIPMKMSSMYFIIHTSLSSRRNFGTAFRSERNERTGQQPKVRIATV